MRVAENQGNTEFQCCMIAGLCRWRQTLVWGPMRSLPRWAPGGMGEVFRARDTRLDRTVAIKICTGHFTERFEREARAISSLNHPHICALYDIGREDTVEFLVMEYLEGESLEARLRKGPLAIEEALQIAIQIASALDAAHRRGMVHRDLKPGNVMLTKSGAKLLDFGLAKMNAPAGHFGDGRYAATRPAPDHDEGTIVGTLQYMSPEQLEGKEADARSDIFSFGAMLYEMITGRKGFSGSSQASLIAAVMTDRAAAGLDASADGLARAGPGGAEMPGEVAGRPLAERGRFAERAGMDCGDGIRGRRAGAGRSEASQPRAHGVACGGSGCGAAARAGGLGRRASAQ